MSAFVINPYAFGAAFDPLTLPNLHAWLDASDTTTTWQDTSATTAATADNDPVGRINDKSGNGNNYTQGASGRRPLLRTGANGQNSLPVLSFDGSDDILTDPVSSNDFADIGYAYIFAAVIDTNRTAGDSWHIPVYVSRNLAQATRFILSTRTNGGNNFSGALRNNTESLSIISATSDANFNILSYITEQAAGNHFLRANGSQIATGSFTSGNFANVASVHRGIGGIVASDGLSLLSGFRFAGQIGEVLIGTGQLTTAQRDACETYLRNKWGTA
jgi:hypothetical protein